MRNDGAWLEEFVKSIEGNLLPPGFEIEARTLVMEEGVCIAELDILISGNVGSSRYSGLIECRDRPSSGAAPVSWIEQLTARRERLNLSQVVAVSTTGFSPAAIMLAERNGVQLREVKSLDISEAKSWMDKITVQFEDEQLDFDIVHMELSDEPRSGMPPIDLEAQFENEDLYCVSSEEGLLGGIYSIFNKGLSQGALSECDVYTPSQLVRHTATFADDLGSFFIGHGTNLAQIKSITFDIIAKKVFKQVQFSNLKSYEDRVTSKTIRWVASANVTLGAIPISVELHFDGTKGYLTWS